MVGLVLFGGGDDMTGHELKRNAYDDSFNQESNLRHWAKVGAAVLMSVKGDGHVTREFLLFDKVRRKHRDSADE